MQYSTVVLVRWKACSSAFCLFETGVVGSNSTPGHGNVPALVLRKYRPTGTPIPRAPINTTFRIPKLGGKGSLGPDCRLLPLQGVVLM